MAKVWDTVLPAKLLAWDIPPAEYREFHDLVIIARAALEEAEQSPRSEILNTKVRVAFENLVEKMLFLHEQYFNSPFLTRIDRVTLGLTAKRKAWSPILAPDAQIICDLVAAGGPHLILVRRIRYLTGPSTDPRADVWHEICYGFTGAPTAAHPCQLDGEPASGDGLFYRLRTRRRSHEFDFQGESGSRLFVTLRLTNDKGDPGPYGPLATIVIP
ncbi:MAG: hypothetical protein LBD24_03810 [Spirochaetaceae bacterium]|jgi:hypothetical protein|nr:hypothetical protein [Spirochaetaceae bacterium]